MADPAPDRTAERHPEPAVTLGRGLELTLLAHLARFPTEQGAVLLGHRDERRVEVVTAVVPEQRETSGVSCSFDVAVIDVIHQALDALDPPERDRIGSVLGWAHSHPWLGVFLSDQDVATLGSWTDLDPSAIAMVLDPHSYRRKIGVWGRHAAARRLVVESERDPVGFPLRTGLPFASELNARPVTRGFPLWDLVCSDGVLTVCPPLPPPTPQPRQR